LKKILLLICVCSGLTAANCQSSSYWQQQVNYLIDVSLNDTAYTLDGYAKMQYYNNSPDTLHFIWFHVWPNAYKNDKTAFSDQLLENGKTDFYFSNNEQRGYMNRLDFKVNAVTAKTEDHPQHQDIIKLILPGPLAPGASIKIETPFHVKLPYNFSRGGHIKQSFQATQWYPKPAVYDKKGWHEMPYLEQGEFYSEFGNYDVLISLPEKYVVASTGILKENKSEREIKTWHFQQENVHDFAWFADKNFLVKHDTLQLSSGTVDLYAYYHQRSAKIWANSISYLKTAVKTKSAWIGDYPYKTVSVVESPDKGDDGMEYPTITFISGPSDEKSLDFLINHEVGHNWFYGILASNERTHPWMDEGMNTYYDNRYSLQQYGSTNAGMNSNSSFIKNRMPDNLMETLLESVTKIKRDQPIETTSEKFNYINYGVIAYTKTGKWMKLLETEMGQSSFDKMMQEYFRRWKFKHPYPEDFRSIAAETNGNKIDSVFSLLTRKGSLQKPVKKDIRIAFLFSMKNTNKHNYIFLSPAIGYNNYDKFMLGGLIHNYTLPPNKLKFVLAPLYGTGSKQLNGIGNINYTSTSENKINKIIVGLTAESFSSLKSLDTNGNKVFERFAKLVPSLQFYFRHSPRSSKTTWIDLRSYLIREKRFDDFHVIAGGDSTVVYPMASVIYDRYVNQLSFNVENSRVLYPYNYQLQLQQGKGFYRLNLNANYYFNYARYGGMQVRLFAAKFGYIGDPSGETYLYQPKLLAITGEEDYTYSNYFIGRAAGTNNSQKPVNNLGIAAQQVMIRDGGLKLRIDQLDHLQGRSDKWVAAMNFNTTLPDIFPIRLPLKLFFDFGTYAEAWKTGAETSRFVYVGGLQLSLIKGLINIYAPLVYTKAFKDALKTFPDQNTFWKRMTFSIDIQNFRLRKLFPQSPF
jgi:hypothetical protein